MRELDRLTMFREQSLRAIPRRNKAGSGFGQALPTRHAEAQTRSAASLEREADGMAERVMRSDAPISVAQDEASWAPTQEGALPATARKFFEPRFGFDFGKVRIHADAAAASSARAENARAYTLGSDIVFGQGQWAPHSHRGRSLLAHELSHVVQQSRSEVAPQPMRKGLDPAPTDKAAAKARLLPKDDYSAAGWHYVEEARSFLAGLGLGDVLDDLEARLAKAEQTLHVMITQGIGAGFHYYRDYELDDARVRSVNAKGIISWNPFRGLKLPSQQIVTPAEILRHEAAHAQHYSTNKDRFLNDIDATKSFDPEYKNKEEKTTIQEVDERGSAIVAKKIGRDPGGFHRNHKDGEWVRVAGPTSATQSA